MWDCEWPIGLVNQKSERLNKHGWDLSIKSHPPKHLLTKLDTHSPGQTPSFPIAPTQSDTQFIRHLLWHSVRHLLTESLIHQSYTPSHPVRHSVIQSLTHSHSVRDLVTHSWSQPDAYYTGRHSLTHWDIHSPLPPPKKKNPVIQSPSNIFAHTVRLSVRY